MVREEEEDKEVDKEDEADGREEDSLASDFLFDECPDWGGRG